METFISYYKTSQLNYSFISIINVISTVIKALMTSAQPHPKKEIGIGIQASLLKKYIIENEDIAHFHKKMKAKDKEKSRRALQRNHYKH